MNKSFILRLGVLIILAMLARTSPAAAEEYSKATLPNLVKALVRFGAINLNDDEILDEYGMATECDLYRAIYKDDFKWNKVRAALRQSIQKNVATFPTSFAYLTKVQLDRYDFKQKLFHFTPGTVMRKVNAFDLELPKGKYCGNEKFNILPMTYKLVLDQPLYFFGLPLNETDANHLLADMKKAHNDLRVMQARLNVQVGYIAPLTRDPVRLGRSSNALRQDHPGAGVLINARLNSIEFFEDEAMTRLVYAYEP